MSTEPEKPLTTLDEIRWNAVKDCFNEREIGIINSKAIGVSGLELDRLIDKLENLSEYALLDMLISKYSGTIDKYLKKEPFSCHRNNK